MPEKFNYGIDTLTIGNAIALANGKLKGVINADASKKIHESHDHVKQIIENNKTVYGINTGFGILANTLISEEDTLTLQYKILQSHSVGVGSPVPVPIAKMMLITKAHALAKGYSGIQYGTM